jgi:ABC-type transport system involved in Fe-S cluster assembly fused permease/ATPase subunit
MSRDIAAEIEKQYGDIHFYYPKIYFGFNSIELTGHLSFYEKINFFVPIVVSCLLFFLINNFAFATIVLVLYIYYLYDKIFILDVIKIDFSRKEIQISNHFPGIDYARSIFKRPSLISFHEIIEFKNYKRSSGQLTPRGNVLVMKTYDHSPIKIAQFRFERESVRLAALLNEHIVGKPGFIK